MRCLVDQCNLYRTSAPATCIQDQPFKSASLSSSSSSASSSSSLLSSASSASLTRVVIIICQGKWPQEEPVEQLLKPYRDHIVGLSLTCYDIDVWHVLRAQVNGLGICLKRLAQHFFLRLRPAQPVEPNYVQTSLLDLLNIIAVSIFCQ